VAIDHRDFSVVAAGPLSSPDPAATLVTRLGPAGLAFGNLDPSFNGGRDLAIALTQPSGLAIRPDSAIYLTAHDGVSGAPSIARIAPSGAPDPTFGNGGALTIPVPGDRSLFNQVEPAGLALRDDGRLVVESRAVDHQNGVTETRGLVAQRFSMLPCLICSLARAGAVKTATPVLLGRIGRAGIIGFLVQRRRPNGRIQTVGRFPLGRHPKGRSRLHWDGTVGGRRMRPGNYLLTLRALGPKGTILGLSRPVRVHLSARRGR
jgi:hypothetical protein